MLNQIIEVKKQEIKELRKKISIDKVSNNSKSKSLKKALAVSGVSLIAELKKASPSKGIICHNFEPLAMARSYEKNGAAAISVLTDEQFFEGKAEYITQLKDIVNIPLLRKDFIIDEIQLYESVLLGADAILLISRVLPYTKLLRLLEISAELGLEVLLEVHQEEEMASLADLPVQIVGINNRDLGSFKTALEKSIELVSLIPKHCLKVSESGIKNAYDMNILEENAFDAALVGEAIVSSKNLDKKLVELVNYRGGNS